MKRIVYPIIIVICLVLNIITNNYIYLNLSARLLLIISLFIAYYDDEYKRTYIPDISKWFFISVILFIITLSDVQYSQHYIEKYFYEVILFSIFVYVIEIVLLNKYINENMKYNFKKIQILFLKIIFSILLLVLFISLFYIFSPKKSNLKFIPNTYNFGKIKKDSIFIGYALIENIGDDTLKIKQIGSDCGCTSVDISKRIILPKDTAKIKFKYRTTNKHGSQENFIIVIANTDSLVHMLQINSLVQ